MLYPQSNPFRQTVDLSGFWELRFDPEALGRTAGWADGFTGGRPAAVPASWNDQFEDGRDYLGDTWYQTHFDLPWGWDASRQRLGISGTPTFYINGIKINATLRPIYFDAAIAHELKKASGQS